MRVPFSWSGDVTRLARAVAKVAAESSQAWCWLDGGESSRSYLGIAEEWESAVPGQSDEFLALLQERTIADRSCANPADGFSGGWIAALGYEFGVELMGLTPAHDTEAPAFALWLDAVLVVDHGRHLSDFDSASESDHTELRGENAAGIERWLAKYGESLRQHLSEDSSIATVASIPELDAHNAGPSVSEGLWSRSPDEYQRDVEQCREAIARGESYVLCLTDTARVKTTVEDPLSLFLQLRDRSTALRGGVIAAGGRALISASPERFLSVRDHTLSTHPIKGTRPRGASPGEDLSLAAELVNDPKERAENLMIVDLMRNDLSQVCEPGTVSVTDFLRVESHPHVHQLVSTIEGKLAPGHGVCGAIRAAFPGGSMTGAPKRRTVQLLAEIERRPRGLYSGCFGWIDRSGDVELAMTIRSIELRGVGPGRGAMALVGSGGGVTIDSNARREYLEKNLKAAALLSTLVSSPGIAREP